MRLRFTVPGPPVPKARARVVRGPAGARCFTPGPTANYQNIAGLRALAARQEVSAWPWRSGTAWFGLSIAVYRSTQRGDWDNYGKAISDACNGVLWPDDRQIREATVKIHECAKGEERAEVEAWGIDGTP